MKEFTVLMYHGIGGKKDKFNLSLENFNVQLDWVVSNGYAITDILSVSKVKQEKFCVFTFDDGHMSDLWVAEKLADLGFKADFFLVQDFLQKDPKRFLTRSQVKRIAELGHAIGVHGKSHTWWTSMEPKKLIKDLSEAKHCFEDLIGRKVEGCSAPGGKINPETVSAIQESKLFKFIRNSKPKSNPINHDIIINSVAIDQFDDLKSFHKKLAGDKIFMKKLLFQYHSKKIFKDLFNK